MFLYLAFFLDHEKKHTQKNKQKQCFVFQLKFLYFTNKNKFSFFLVFFLMAVSAKTRIE